MKLRWVSDRTVQYTYQARVNSNSATTFPLSRILLLSHARYLCSAVIPCLPAVTSDSNKTLLLEKEGIKPIVMKEESVHSSGWHAINDQKPGSHLNTLILQDSHLDSSSLHWQAPHLLYQGPLLNLQYWQLLQITSAYFCPWLIQAFLLLLATVALALE